MKRKKLIIQILAGYLLMGLFLSCGGDGSETTGPGEEVIISDSAFYVAPSGDDNNPGTLALPWKTITKAAQTLQGGDTVYIRAGTYNERVVPSHSGAEDHPIVYIAYPGETVTIDGQGITLPADWGGLVDLSNRSYVEISGLRIVNAGPNMNSSGILVDYANHIIIKNNYVNNTVSSGIAAWQSTNVIIDNNEVVLACNDGEQECITIAGTDSFVVSNNYVHNSGPGTYGGEGIDIKDGASNGKIYGNHVHDINRLGLYIDAWDKHTHNFEIFRNVVHHCAGDGFTIASEQGGLLENISIYNNLIYSNNNLGLAITPNGDVPEPPMQNIGIVNNTIYNNGVDVGAATWGGGIGVDNPNITNLLIRNNIVSQNLQFQILVEVTIPSLMVDHNLVDGYRDYSADEIIGTESMAGDPLFVNPAGGDFHIQSGSPAIDMGTASEAPALDFDLKTRPVGAGYDIGAYEL
jgi:hypothetical protein